MDGRKTKKWQFILFLTVVMIMFVISVVALSATNSVSGLFSAETYRNLFETRPAETTKDTEETALDTEEVATGVEDTQSEKSETVEVEKTAEETTVQTETETQPPVETEPPLQNTDGSFVPPVATETDEELEDEDGYIIPPDQRTEPAIPGRISEYAVEQSARVDDSFFDDALFIGDSRTQGIQYCGFFSNSTFYAYKGLNTITAMKSPFVMEYEEEMMLVDALALHPEYQKIYVCFGLNDFWFTESAFREKYTLLIEAIKASASPDAQIYMYSVVPVLDGMQKSDSGLNNAKMIRLNQIACEIAQATGVKFVDVSEAFIKEDGFRYLTEDETPDGVHLNYAQVNMICEYLRTHT